LGETILMYCRIFARGRWWKAQIWAQIEESGWLPAQFLDMFVSATSFGSKIRYELFGPSMAAMH
jgi:hypothetical protein